MLQEQIIEVSEEEQIKEICDFVKKYRLDFKRRSEKPKAKVIWELFIILALANTIIGLIYQNLDNLLIGYFAILVLYISSSTLAKYHEFNIKVN